MSVEIETFPVYPLGCNCSIIHCNQTKEAIIIDPGGDEKNIIAKLSSKGLSVKYIIHTHAHFDHCLGTKSVSDQYPAAKIGLHKEDLNLYQNIKMQCSFFGINYNSEVCPINHYLENEEELSWGATGKLQVLHTPGHTPGSVCFVMPTSEKQVAFSGDTLFQGGIGRTDLWGGDYETIIKSINTRLMPLDDSTMVIPGHGGFSTIYQEKRTNPYLL